ncbi:MAG: hypothetical protein RI935_479 [Candidatus Parcubacteria bacterium]|jgi:predicted nucleotidyltransferase component of viral defense system
MVIYVVIKLSMIDKKEIEEKAKYFEINPTHVEKDYVFGWVLFGIFTASNLKDIFFLKGGNALRKGYFENTRYSNDLDFGIHNDVDPDFLLQELNKVCDFIQEKNGVVFTKDDNKVKDKFKEGQEPVTGLKVYEAKLYFKDFYGNPDIIKIKISMDITRFDKVILPIQKVKLIHPYSDSGDLQCEISCMKLEEIVATKLKCLLQRQHAPDLFDYVYSIKLLGGSLNKEEVVEVLIQKTIFRKNPNNLKDILLKTPFDYFREFWGKSVICSKEFLLDIEDAITFFLEDLENLFKIYPDNGYRSSIYFSPDFRVPIMKAGRDQKVIKIKYRNEKGISEERFVEPYSIKYMRKEDGTEFEYLYAYKLRGGFSSPSIKIFRADRMVSVENTEETFDPKYQIELCKSGEKPEKPYFFDPNKPAKSPARIITRVKRFGGFSSTKYIYECSYCNKKFTKSKQDGKLNPHKDKFGNNCYGRHGYYVDTKY